MRVCFRIDLPEEPRAVQRIGAFAQGPAILQHQRIGVSNVDCLIEPLELAINESPMRPRASPGHVEAVAAVLRREPAVRLYPVMKFRGLPLEIS